MDVYFNGSGYDTPEDTRRYLLDRIFMNTRFFFVAGYVAEIMRARSLANSGLYDRKTWVQSSYRIFKLAEGCGGLFRIRGLNHLRESEGPFVFISNHMSTLETFVFPCIIGPLMEITFVVKDSLIKHPLFGPVMRSRNPIVVGRNNPREDFQAVMNQGREKIVAGTSVVIFPQSTRRVEFIPEEFNSLGIKLAKATGAQVVPVAIRTDFWGNGKFLKDVGPVNRHIPINIAFGQPFFVNGSGKEEHKRVIDFIEQNLRQWGVPIRVRS